jgi:hypothetical protein
MTTHVIAGALAVALLGGWAPAADAAFVGKREARTYLLGAVPRGAPRVMLPDERAGFFHTAGLWVQPARRCHRRAAAAVSPTRRTARPTGGRSPAVARCSSGGLETAA